MGIIKIAFNNHAYSIFILLCTIVGGGALVQYRVEQLEVLTQKQTDSLLEVNQSMYEMKIDLTVIKVNQENYIKWQESANVVALNAHLKPKLQQAN